MKDLSGNFFAQLLWYCLRSKEVLDLVNSFLDPKLMPDVAYEWFVKQIRLHYIATGGKFHSIAGLSLQAEKISDDDKLDKIVFLLERVDSIEKGEGKEQIIFHLNTYIRESKFLDLHERVADLFNKNERDKAINVLAKESQEISSFTIFNERQQLVYKDFEERNKNRKEAYANRDESFDLSHESKIPTGIHALDYYIGGGVERGKSFLFMARSGGYKSTFLRWCGNHAASLGFNVVHFQAEGKKQEVLNKYDSLWTGVSNKQIEIGHLPKDKQDKILAAHKNLLSRGGDIYVSAHEQFGSFMLEQCYSTLVELSKTIRIDLIIFDYLELFNIGGFFSEKNGERMRREKIANGITNMGVEFNAATMAAYQAMDIKTDDYNNPHFIMRRSHANEFKGIIKPFSYFVTGNQTDDEYDSEIMRINIDKLRDEKGNRLFKIKMAPEFGKFYDSKNTLRLFWDISSNKAKSPIEDE